MMSALSNPVQLPWSLGVGGLRGGGRTRRRACGTCSCLLWLQPTDPHYIPLLGIHVKIATPLRLSQVGETMPSLVLQTHPVESAASSTALSQSCFCHAHLASSIYMTVASVRRFLCYYYYWYFLYKRKFNWTLKLHPCILKSVRQLTPRAGAGGGVKLI